MLGDASGASQLTGHQRVLYANALRKFSRTLPVAKARAEVRRLWTWKAWPVDEETMQDAWDLQDRISVSYWDALMVSAARQLGCGFVLTEDLQHGQQIDGVQVVNPFVVGPEIVETAA